jgi:hypothetical protein
MGDEDAEVSSILLNIEPHVSDAVGITIYSLAQSDGVVNNEYR